MIFAGIDPGLTGAVAIYENGEISLIDTPICEGSNGRKIKNEYSPGQMAAIFDPIGDKGQCHVFLEKVGPMPKQGVVSMFGFGKGYGIWIGILSALKIPYTLVTPQSWKKEIMGGGAKEKDAARIRAQQLFPKLSADLSRKKDIGRADALLIAEYGRRVLIGVR